MLQTPVRPVHPDTELVTVAEMADRLAMTRKGFGRLVREAGIPKVKLGHRTVRYAPALVIAIVAGCRPTWTPTRRAAPQSPR